MAQITAAIKTNQYKKINDIVIEKFKSSLNDRKCSKKIIDICLNFYNTFKQDKNFAYVKPWMILKKIDCLLLGYKNLENIEEGLFERLKKLFAIKKSFVLNGFEHYSLRYGESYAIKLISNLKQKHKQDSLQKVRDFLLKSNQSKKTIDVICEFCKKQDKYAIRKIIKNIKKLLLTYKNLDDIEEGVIDRLNVLFSIGKDTSSKKSFELRYGKELGGKLWLQKTQKTTQTSEKLIKKYGVRKTKEIFRLRSANLEVYIERWGEELGKKKWNEYCEKRHKTFEINRKNGKYEGMNTLESYIKLYGKKQGAKRFNQRLDKAYRTMLNNKSVTTKRFSQVSMRFFKKLETKLKQINKNCKVFYGENEKKITINEKQRYYADFFYHDKDKNIKKIIEFYGDYWHANPEFYSDDDLIVTYSGKFLAKEIRKKDAKRIRKINKKYKTKILWENQVKTNEQKVLDKMVEFLLK